MDTQFQDDRREGGSIGIGAMIVFIALILVAAVASTIIIKTAEELQQNAENTSADTREQISGKMSIMDIFIASTADELAGNGDTHVKTMDIFLRVASGSIGVQDGDVDYYISCRLTTGTNTGAETAVDQVIIESDTLDMVHLDGSAVATGDDLEAGKSYKSTITLADADPIETGTSANEIDSLDIGTPATLPGCDATATAGTTMSLRLVVDGGGETLSELNVDSITLGSSLM
jgi:flagellin FlaB